MILSARLESPMSQPKPTPQLKSISECKPESKTGEKATQTITRLVLKTRDEVEVAPTFVTVEDVPMTLPAVVEIGAEGSLRGVVVS